MGTLIFLENIAGGTLIRVGSLIRHCIVYELSNIACLPGDTVQVRKLVDRESQEPLFNEFLWGDLVTFKTKFFYPNHSFRSVMVKKYFHKANILLNKLLH